jgi:hypothetical protein
VPGAEGTSRQRRRREERARARDPVVVESKRRAAYNAAGAAFSTSEHGPLLSSHETPLPPSPSQNRVLSAKTTTKRRAVVGALISGKADRAKAWRHGVSSSHTQQREGRERERRRACCVSFAFPRAQALSRDQLQAPCSWEGTRTAYCRPFLRLRHMAGLPCGLQLCFCMRSSRLQVRLATSALCRTGCWLAAYPHFSEERSSLLLYEYQVIITNG